MDHLRPKYMTPAEAAMHLRCCRATVYKRIKRGTIPHRRFGDSILIPVSFLEEDGTTWENNDAKKATMPSEKIRTVQFPVSRSRQ
jgi:excisionase family DNA binding protein